jgi:ParB-like chromosome segregation protein Spo0J
MSTGAATNVTERGKEDPLTDLIVRISDVQLASGVVAEEPATWLRQSNFSKWDYSGTEGLPSWEQWGNDPNEIQHIRTYLVLPSPDQPRSPESTGKDTIAPLMRDIAATGINTPLKVRREGDNLVVVAGNTRLLCAVNANFKLVPCTFRPEDEQLKKTTRLIDEVRSNMLQRPMNPKDVVTVCLRILALARQERQGDLTAEEALGLLATIGCTRDDAAMYLRVGCLDERVLELLDTRLISLDQAHAIAKATQSRDASDRGALQLEIARQIVLGMSSTQATIDRVLGTQQECAQSSGNSGQKPRTRRQRRAFNFGGVQIRVIGDEGVTHQQMIEALEGAARQLRQEAAPQSNLAGH